jgi:regulator of protease activity HflC (stomatin/prohibitin superfamily)
MHREKEVVEVAEDVACQAVALRLSVNIATVESTAGPFLGPYHAVVDLVASANDAAIAEAYVVGMVVPQDQPDEEDGVSDDIEALFGDSSDGDVVVPTMTDEQVALLTSFETAHCEEGTRQFMAAEREALAAMLVVRANAAREAAHVAAQEEAARVASRAAEAAAAREVAARVAARAEELAEEAAADAAAHEEMVRDRHRWDDDIAAARCVREVHKLAS